MKMSWRAIFEQYVYTKKKKKMEHHEEMLNKGYTDCGVVSSMEPDSDGTYKRYPAGKYIRYLSKEEQLK